MTWNLTDPRDGAAKVICYGSEDYSKRSYGDLANCLGAVSQVASSAPQDKANRLLYSWWTSCCKNAAGDHASRIIAGVGGMHSRLYKHDAFMKE